MKVPGILYSVLLAAAAYLVEYFTTGVGAGLPWATIALAAIPVLLKAFTVNAPSTNAPQPQSDSGGPAPSPEQRSKMQRFLLG